MRLSPLKENISAIQKIILSGGAESAIRMMKEVMFSKNRIASQSRGRLGALIGCLVGLWTGAMDVTAGLEPVTGEPWREAVISVTDPDVTARFFKEIGGYEELGRGVLSDSAIAAWGLAPEATGEYLLLRAPMGGDFGHVRLVSFANAGRRVPMRPGARAWDTGCYFSTMIRVKDI